MLAPTTTTPRIQEQRKGTWARTWYKFRRNPASVVGLVVVLLIILLAVAAPIVTPFPHHAGIFTDFTNASLAPNAVNWFGTDTIGRDLFTRVIFGYQLSLVLGVVVLALAVPVGVILGLCAGYFGGWTETIIMRITDVFLSIPPLVLALAIMGFLPPTLTNAMIAVSVMWWPWYTRLVYNLTRSLRGEGYVTAAEIIGASPAHILLRELLPNCAPSILTKMTLDLGFVILIASSLSFLGLGVQPPTPDLGTMVADGMRYLPDLWWLSLFPGLAILLLVFGLNLLGDGLRDALGADV